MGAKLSNTGQQRTQTREIHQQGSGGGAVSYQLRGGLGGSGEGRTRARTIQNSSRPLQPNRSSIAGTEMETSPSTRARRRRRRDFQHSDLTASHSLPAHLFSAYIPEVKCPVCSKTLRSSEVESHLLQCLTKPRIVYNEDILANDAGECVICFEDLSQGERIARLPCLCIYHKGCIDDWFQRNRCCPEHPEELPQPPRDHSDLTAE